MFLSSVTRYIDLFDEGGEVPLRAHATFFGCDECDQNSWVEALNADVQATEYMVGGFKHQGRACPMGTSERSYRLGIDLRNNKRDQIRIAPMRDSDIEPDLLSNSIKEVEKWIRNALGQARSGGLPRSFQVVSEKEKPKDGEPFDVLWAKFDFDDDMWDDEIMWDIRFLLMGSKLQKLRGFPLELNHIRDKLIYIERQCLRAVKESEESLRWCVACFGSGRIVAIWAVWGTIHCCSEVA